MKTKIIFFFFLFSYSMVFSFERGNNIPMVLLLCLFFFMFYRSDNKVLRFLAILALSMAAGIKIYPIIIALLLLRERDYRGFVWCFILTAFMYTVPFLFTDGNPMMLLDNLKNTSGGNIKVTGLTGIHKYFMSLLVGILPDIVLTILGYVIALAIGIVILLIVMKDDVMDEWKMFLLVIMTMIFTPSISTTEYMMVFMLIPVLYFFETRREPSKMNYVYTVLLALSMVLMVGFSVSFLPFQEQTIVSGIKTAVLWALLFLVFVEGCIDLNRKRKAGTVGE